VIEDGKEKKDKQGVLYIFWQDHMPDMRMQGWQMRMHT